ncbi:MAG: hypothetical protein NT027_11460 [Proteobacteria bacterium]|nr:hypothetical protein [Pseudomonadota bacterium]
MNLNSIYSILFAVSSIGFDSSAFADYQADRTRLQRDTRNFKIQISCMASSLDTLATQIKATPDAAHLAPRYEEARLQTAKLYSDFDFWVDDDESIGEIKRGLDSYATRIDANFTLLSILPCLPASFGVGPRDCLPRRFQRSIDQYESNFNLLRNDVDAVIQGLPGEFSCLAVRADNGPGAPRGYGATTEEASAIALQLCSPNRCRIESCRPE